MLTLAEYLGGWNLGLDQLLFREAPEAVGTAYPGRMALNTAVNFLLAGIALLRLAGRRGQVWFHFAVVAVIWISLLGLAGYLTGGIPLFGLDISTQMAVHTALAFLVLGAGLWGAHFTVARQPLPGFERVLAMSFGTVLALLALLDGVTYQNTQRMKESGEWRARTLDVQEALETLRSTMSDAETGMRDFVLTGQQSYLEPYSAARAQIQNRLRAVRTLTADNPAQQQRLTELAGLIQTNLQYRAGVVQLARTQGLEPARQAVLTGEGKRSMDAIRRGVDTLKAEEDRLLARHLAAWQSSNSAVRLTLALLSGVIMALLLASYHLLKTNVAARLRAIETLREKEQRLSESQRIAHIGSWSWNLTGPIYWTDETYRIYGVSPETFTPTAESLINLVHPDDRPLMQRWLAACLAGEKPADLEFRSLRPDGTVRFINSRGELKYDAAGKPFQMVGTAQDITGRKQAEAALRETNAYLENLINHANAPIIVWNPQFQITRFNHAFESLTSRRANEVIGNSLELLFPPALVEHSMALIKQTTGGACWETVEIPILRLDGSVRTVLWNSATIFAPDGKTPAATIAQGQDITDRKQMEAALRVSEERFRIAAETTNDVVYDWDLKQSLQWFGKIDEMLGYGPGEFPRTLDAWASSVHPEDVEHTMAQIQAHLEERVPYAAEYRVRRKDGVYRWWSARGAAARTPDGKPIRMIGSITDITERRQAEEALRESEQKFRILFDQANDGMMLADAETKRVTLVNRQIQQMLGYSEAELCQLTVADIHPAADLPAVFEQFEKQALGELSLITNIPMRRKDGTVFYADINTAPIRLQQHNCLLGVFRDITERKAAEAQLKRTLTDLERSNKDLEQFAFVASHDLQEPLRMVASYTQLLAQRYQDQLDDKARKYIHYAVDGSIRMQTLINDLLAYSRVGRKGQPLAPTDAHAVLGEAIQNLAVSIQESHALITNDDLPTVRADATQLLLVFQNLIGNAIKFRRDDLPRVHVSARDQGGEWVFAVKDNGIGIEPQHADRVFVIFQRLHTKEEYPGTGIGLAVCRRIVERHGGKIWFESEPGKGSTFFFTVPK